MKICYIPIFLAVITLLAWDTSAQLIRVRRATSLSSSDLSTLMSSIVSMMMPSEIFSMVTSRIEEFFTNPTGLLTELNSLGSLGRKRRAAYYWPGNLKKTENRMDSKQGPTSLKEHSEEALHYEGMPLPFFPVLSERKRVARNTDVIPGGGAMPGGAEVQTKGMETAQSGMEGMGKAISSGAKLGKAASEVGKSGKDLAESGGKGAEMMSNGAETVSAGASQGSEMASSFGKK